MADKFLCQGRQGEFGEIIRPAPHPVGAASGLGGEHHDLQGEMGEAVMHNAG